MVASCVLFDLYGTLMIQDAPDDVTLAGRIGRLLAALGHEVDGGTLADALAATSVPYVASDGLTPFERLLSESCHAIGVPLSRSDVRVLASRCSREWQSHLKLDAASAPVLQELRQRRQVGLVTSYDHPPHVRDALQTADMADAFETVVVSGEVGIKKPDAAIMHLALGRLGMGASQAVYVGDSIVDYEAATAAGMRFVLIRRPDQARSAGIAERYAETDRLLESRAAASRIRLVETLESLVPTLDHWD